jgi:hypothetical protein
MALAKVVNTNGSTTQKNLGASTQNITNPISESRNQSQGLAVDFVVSI